MKWNKQGHIYCPAGTQWWAKTHAYIPTASLIADRCIRVYFASLDNDLYGRIGYVDLDIHDPGKILHLSSEPVLDLGPRGTFDDSGVSPSCLITIDGRKHLYYIGWQRTERTPHLLYAGLAWQSKGNTIFQRYSNVPVLDRTAEEPYSRSAPFVLRMDGIYKMWYWSCTHWSQEGDWIHYNNEICHITSPDGINWTAASTSCIEPRAPKEYALGRPWVIHENGIYRMWYSIRRSVEPTYIIGYAESRDGLHWVRKDDEVGIHASSSGWDSEMICFPCVIDVEEKRYLFYNGNQHGKNGFGYAVLEHD